MNRFRKGFTLAELLIVVAIIAVLVAIAIPVFTSQLEKSRESRDLANVRSAYAEVMAAVNADEKEASGFYDQNTKTYKYPVFLGQKQADWQSSKPITVGDINSETDENTYWRNAPVREGTCLVSFTEGDEKPVIDWKGYSDTHAVQNTKTSVQNEAGDYLNQLRSTLSMNWKDGKTLAQYLIAGNKNDRFDMGNGVYAYYKTTSGQIDTMDSPAAGNNKTWINFTLDENGNVVMYNFAKNEYAYSTKDATQAELVWQGNATIK